MNLERTIDTKKVVFIGDNRVRYKVKNQVQIGIGILDNKIC